MSRVTSTDSKYKSYLLNRETKNLHVVINKTKIKLPDLVILKTERARYGNSNLQKCLELLNISFL